MKTIRIIAGLNKRREPEQFKEIELNMGEVICIVGSTGSGKSRLIKDIEQLVDGDSITNRKILIDDQSISYDERLEFEQNWIAHLSQNMRFVLDVTVKEFLYKHGVCRNKKNDLEQIVSLANQITSEPIDLEQHLNLLSGGQTRALMVADIALVCDSPIVLIDEIENAGIDKIKALESLISPDKLVFVVTHDPHIALFASKRIVMKHGEIIAVIETSEEEKKAFLELENMYQKQREYQTLLREGKRL